MKGGIPTADINTIMTLRVEEVHPEDYGLATGPFASRPALGSAGAT